MGGSARNLEVLEGGVAPRQSPYQRLSQRMLDISGDRGVLKDVLREGTGGLVTPDASVLVKYSGYLEHMDRPFDSNCFRKTPRLMKLGEDITLWGMELGLLSMRKGELARFLFKPTYAYGTLGCPPLIPPNTTVLFEIELLDFLDSAESDKFCALSAEQQDQFPLQKVLKVAATEREFGNYLFRQNRFYDAKVRYKRALLLLRRRSAPLEEQHLVEAAKLLVLLNLSFTYLKLERPTMALRYGEQSLIIDQKNAKALFRCGQACLLMTEYQKARDFLVRAQKEQPFNHDINNELKKLASYYRDYMDKEKEMCHRMFAPGDNDSTVGDTGRWGNSYWMRDRRRGTDPASNSGLRAAREAWLTTGSPWRGDALGVPERVARGRDISQQGETRGGGKLRAHPGARGRESELNLEAVCPGQRCGLATRPPLGFPCPPAVFGASAERKRARRQPRAASAAWQRRRQLRRLGSARVCVGSCPRRAAWRDERAFCLRLSGLLGLLS
ncbi:inactive peptidyl-prolyl cis-trans isomerase FKBP6 [Trichechus manatus latirostris]|uniref:peptidylprolyl isomerase n=1 Tax=Trichechus manatus latirostris TaxID=127582 RepID=A0A2Y9DV05_TRIMA|nr:inactive peptidyl-prolyl cis-trans isomerase FKBP6 [Trichechus manatus latirostris]